MKIYILTLKMIDRLGRDRFKELRIVSKQLSEDEYNDALSDFKRRNNEYSDFVLINSLELLR